MHFHPNTMLYDGQYACRARDHGPAVSAQGLHIEFFWLPPLRCGYDVTLLTTRGRVWAGDLQEDDWVVFPRYQMPDYEVPDTKYLHIQDDTHQAFCILKKLSEHQAGSMIDMMDCGDHVAHWRNDCWLLSQRQFEPWFVKFHSEFSTELHARVLSVGEDFCNMVNVTTPIAEAYGLQI
jgi:hypothetical protein